MLLSLAAMGCDKAPILVTTENNGAPPSSQQPEATQPQQSIPLSTSRTKSRDSVDPKSAAGASEVLASYTGLLEEKRWLDARRLWTEGSDAAAVEAQLLQFDRVKADAGYPGPTEGAAGSIYVEIPLHLTGTTNGGEQVSLAGMATLRRVNDVPGSTEMQRRWHIYRLDLQPRP